MNRIRLYERIAGRLLVRVVRLRARRGNPEDAHELRHLWAAVNAGTSDGCDGAACTLDGLNAPAAYPNVWPPA
jgi:hypothetical protein